MEIPIHWFAHRATRLIPSLLVALALVALVPRSSLGQATYHIGESSDFTGNGCPNDDVNIITETLEDVINLDSWVGTRFVNSQNFVSDFVEHCSSAYMPSGSTITYGYDHYYADAHTFTVFAGHGNVGLLQFGKKKYNMCLLDFSDNMRLGAMAGNESGVAWYLASCTMDPNSFTSEANWQWLRQQYGFKNSPSIDDDMPAYVYMVSGQYGWGNTKDSWLILMDDASELYGSGDDTPVVLTHGTSSQDCQYVHNNASLKDQTYTSEMPNGPSCQGGYPYFWYCYSIVNNGGCP